MSQGHIKTNNTISYTNRVKVHNNSKHKPNRQTTPAASLNEPMLKQLKQVSKQQDPSSIQ